MSQNDMKGSFSKDMSLFEKRIFSESSKNVRVGWVKKITHNCCQLSINPWNHNIIFKEKYIIPSDILIEEGDFIELDVGRPEAVVTDVDRRNLIAKEMEIFRLIISVKRRTNPLSVPNIKSIDFLNALCDGWNDAESDHLNETIAIQILSCPGLNISIGGLGSESAHYNRLKGPVDRLQKEISKALPSCMKRENGNFEFQFVGSSQESDQLETRKKKMASKEISYNYAPSIRKLNVELKINFPTMIKNATAIGPNSSFDEDFYDYLLTAHTNHPLIEPGIDNKIGDYIENLKNERLNDFIDYNIKIDPNSITKVGLALCRLEFKKYLDESILKRSWHLCSELYNDYIDYLKSSYDFIDLPNGEKKRIKEKENWAEKLSKDEMIVLSKIRNMSDDNKNDRILVNDIIELLMDKLDRQKIELAIEKLSLKGFVFLPSSFEIKIVSED